jgi:hypothetical protein
MKRRSRGLSAPSFHGVEMTFLPQKCHFWWAPRRPARCGVEVLDPGMMLGDGRLHQVELGIVQDGPYLGQQDVQLPEEQDL